MAGKSRISWALDDQGRPAYSWNPLLGCAPISPGCDHCWARSMARRFYAKRNRWACMWQGQQTVLNPILKAPKYSLVIVQMLGDLFLAEDCTYAREVLRAIQKRPDVTFLLLTKRPWNAWRAGDGLPRMENVWLGVSVEDQEHARLRMPVLGACYWPGHLWASAEPLLGDVWLSPYLPTPPRPLEWIVGGGENGPGARKCKAEWADSLRRTAERSEVPFFWKGFGAHDANGNRLSKKDESPILNGVRCDARPRWRT